MRVFIIMKRRLECHTNHLQCQDTVSKSRKMLSCVNLNRDVWLNILSFVSDLKQVFRMISVCKAFAEWLDVVYLLKRFDLLLRDVNLGAFPRRRDLSKFLWVDFKVAEPYRYALFLVETADTS